MTEQSPFTVEPLNTSENEITNHVIEMNNSSSDSHDIPEIDSLVSTSGIVKLDIEMSKDDVAVTKGFNYPKLMTIILIFVALLILSCCVIGIGSIILFIYLNTNNTIGPIVVSSMTPTVFPTMGPTVFPTPIDYEYESYYIPL